MTGPQRTAAPAGARPVGEPPFLAPGEELVWHHRRRSWTEGVPETAFATRVVRHDARGLVAWLAGGTVGLVPLREDGGDLRADKTTMFSAPRRQGQRAWTGDGVLRIAPAGVPWSVWLFHDPPTATGRGRFRGWYVNLEDPQRMLDGHLFTSDLVLDVVVSPDGTSTRKDEDELELAVAQGRFTAAEAREIEQFADRAEQSVREGDWPFGAEWTRWHPGLLPDASHIPGTHQL